MHRNRMFWLVWICLQLILRISHPNWKYLHECSRSPEEAKSPHFAATILQSNLLRHYGYMECLPYPTSWTNAHS
ncbi:hypothetical protein MRB53_007406 [Persea americana]|uniref:Uncharacterized protein n=1 Tax=Persea americana TaxID=3435 RepID=A0ACC2MJY1_PERAE|nr:hypothetical protein MRB53_007406 [Persea americana]